MTDYDHSNSAETRAGVSLHKDERQGGRHLGRQSAPAMHSPHSSAPMPPKPKRDVKHYKISFTGNTQDFFKIWIVNMALTIVTLGIYLPWARVRTQQYFYGHTWLDGHNFEYTANPLVLLRSYLIVGGAFILFNAAAEWQFQGYEWIVIILPLIFVGLYPWLVRQSMRFLARNTRHRGLSFGFHGSVGDAYMAYGVTNLISIFAGMLTLPWAWFTQRSYQFNNLSFGKAKGRFRGELGEFYKIGLIGFGVGIAGMSCIFVIIWILFGVMGGMAVLMTGGGADAESNLGPAAVGSVFIGFMIVYLGIIFIYNAAWMYVRAATLNYVMQNGELGGVVRSSSSIDPIELVKISIVNSVAQTFSLGLLGPWAAVRVHKYIVENIHIRSLVELSTFHSLDAETDESALGEAASDLLNMDMGF